jgi:AraC-like DNA-binding protein
MRFVSVIRSAALRGLRSTVAELGGDADVCAQAVGLPVEALDRSGTRQFGSRVRVAVQQTLGTTSPDIATIAAVLCVHPRTLQRRLAEENTTFAAVLDDVRRNAARRYLTGTDMPMTQVAALLGFAEQSQLSRSCQRWWSTTPSQLRRRHADPGWDPNAAAR